MKEGAAFSSDYARFHTVAREGAPVVSEEVVQCLWFDRLYRGSGLQTASGKAVRVLSPGWWNQGEGPDFRGAQIEIAGTLHSGDIEIHLDHAAWKQHGHHVDPRYDDVILVVVLDTRPPSSPPVTSSGRAIPCLLLGKFLELPVALLADTVVPDDFPYDTPMAQGKCAEICGAYGAAHLLEFLRLAGEWRLLNKARAMGERISRVGADQAIYEMFMTACGFVRYKNHFHALARQLPYERVVQLARLDPMLVETAFLQLGGLLPSLQEDAHPHHVRLSELREAHLSGLRSLPLGWSRSGVRPCNYPERRLAGAARFLARTSKDGIASTLASIWKDASPPLQRRRALEALFPRPMGFWAEHYSWTSERLAKPVALLGAGRVRSIIGNVFVPAALAMARQRQDRTAEEGVHALFAALPKEPDNHIVKIMLPRLFGKAIPLRIDFRAQQGLLQVYQDWCRSNPSCRNCFLVPHLDKDSRVPYPSP
ncbi:MAG: DUF2851 family protein [Candidatus Hydrogenedentes bacterium]|nr:DUF2851 family protein [Candidatus Hydrogenedentota bacterium]